MKLLADDELDAEARAHAAAVVSRIDDPEAADSLLDVLSRGTAPGDVLRSAAEAVGRIREPEGVARRVQDALLLSPRDEAKIAAAEALRLAKDREGLPDVRRALADARGGSAKVRAALAMSLGELGGRADRGTLEAMKESDPDPDVREAAARGLQRLDEILLSWPDR
jgi:HEAT repeat protein